MIKHQKIKTHLKVPDYKPWWRELAVVEIRENGKSKAKANAGFWYENFWKPRELAVWIYELVRRLPNTKIDPADLTEEHKKTLRKLPPYPELSESQKARLLFSITRMMDSQLKKEETVSVYNTADERHLPKWRRGQPDKWMDWRQVEALGEAENRHKVEEKESRLEKRRLARAHAIKLLPLILAAWTVMEETPDMKKLVVPLLKIKQQFSLSGAVFTETELVSAVDQAYKRRPKK